MKSLIRHSYGLILLLSCLFFACEDKVERTRTLTANVPVYMDFEEFRATKSALSARELILPGKICMYGDYLFINEIGEGIHIIDNSNPSSPKNTSFLEVIGNRELTVKEGLLFADSYIDLVCFDISDPKNPVEIGRSENVFPYVLPEPDNNYPVDEIDLKKGVVVDWEVKTITREVDFNPVPEICYDMMTNASSSSWASAGNSKTVTVTGSTSKFTINEDFLFALDGNSLSVFQIERDKVTKLGSVYCGYSPETLFYYEDKLFMGTPFGMLIYTVENPRSPSFLSFTGHVLGCDPVVVQGDYAYVTVRAGNLCGQNANILDVIDIRDPKHPLIKATFNMECPYGLSIDGNRLFVCDNGLKIFDATDPLTVGNRLLSSFGDMNGFDVISYNGLLMLIGTDGLYQYNYSNANVSKLSVIPVKK